MRRQTVTDADLLVRAGHVSLATVVLVELRAAPTPCRRHAAVALDARLAHPVAAGARGLVHDTPQEQGNYRDYHAHQPSYKRHDT